MGDSVIHHVEVQVLILLLIASLVGMFARRIRLPYTLVLAGLGLSLARLEALSDLALTPDLLLLLLLLLFLPPLLFEAAYHLPFDDLRRNGPHIAFLDIFGVLVSVGLTGLGTFVAFGRLGLGDGFGWVDAFLFASVIAATDRSRGCWQRSMLDWRAWKMPPARTSSRCARRSTACTRSVSSPQRVIPRSSI